MTKRVRGAFFSQVGDREGYTGVLERDFNGANAKAKEVDRRMGGDVPRLRQLAYRHACCVSHSHVLVRRPVGGPAWRARE